MAKTYALIIDHNGENKYREVHGLSYAKECFQHIKNDPLTFSVALNTEEGKQLKYWERK